MQRFFNKMMANRGTDSSMLRIMHIDSAIVENDIGIMQNVYGCISEMLITQRRVYETHPNMQIQLYEIDQMIQLIDECTKILPIVFQCIYEWNILLASKDNSDRSMHAGTDSTELRSMFVNNIIQNENFWKVFRFALYTPRISSSADFARFKDLSLSTHVYKHVYTPMSNETNIWNILCPDFVIRFMNYMSIITERIHSMCCQIWKGFGGLISRYSLMNSQNTMFNQYDIGVLANLLSQYDKVDGLFMSIVVYEPQKISYISNLYSGYNKVISSLCENKSDIIRLYTITNEISYV